MLPLEFSDPSLFGDYLQFMSGRVTFLLEPAGVAVSIVRVPVRRPGGVGSARWPRGITRRGRSCSWSRSGVPLDEPESAKRIVRDETRSKRRLWRSRWSPPPTSASAASFSLVAGRAPIATVGHEVLGSTSAWRERARVSKGLEGREFGERLRAPEVLIYGTDKEIVSGDRGAYPKEFGKWRDSFDRMVAGSFEIHAESYSVWLVEIQLCCDWVVFWV
jgi:hypothetical protein